MTQVVKITKSTFNVLSETDPRNFVFDSTLNHLKTGQSGSITVTSAGTDIAGISWGTVTHNLSYRPLVVAYFQDSGTPGLWYQTMAYSSGLATRLSSDLNVGQEVGTDSVIFSATSQAGTSGWSTDTMYEIFYEGA